MPTSTLGSARASVSVEDISRQYYEAAGYSRWITQMHVDPLELIVADDADGKLYRVPVEMGKGGKFTFGEEQEVAIEYKDVKTPAGSKAAASMPYRWATKAAALSAAGVAETTVTTTEPVESPAEPKVERTLPPADAIRKVAAATATKTPDVDTTTGQPDKTKEASGMAIDAAKIREALGLSADAPLTDEAKAELLAALGLTESKPATGDDVAALLAAIPQNAGVRVLDEQSYAALIQQAGKGALAWQRMEANERDSFLDKACRVEGRFPPAQLKKYQDMYEKNPAATKEFINLMPKNAVPTMLSGSYGAEHIVNEADDAYAGVYGKEA